MPNKPDQSGVSDGELRKRQRLAALTGKPRNAERKAQREGSDEE